MNYCRKMEERIAQLEEEGRRTREEVSGLRDKLEKEVWARQRLEEKLKERESADSGRQEEPPREWKQVMEETETRVLKKIEEKEREREREKQKKHCIIFTDSNGRNTAMPESVKSHIPAEERDNYEVKLVITYRVAEALDKVKAGGLGINGAIVVIDCLSNDARQTRNGPHLSPCKLTER